MASTEDAVKPDTAKEQVDIPDVNENPFSGIAGEQPNTITPQQAKSEDLVAGAEDRKESAKASENVEEKSTKDEADNGKPDDRKRSGENWKRSDQGRRYNDRKRPDPAALKKLRDKNNKFDPTTRQESSDPAEIRKQVCSDGTF